MTPPPQASPTLTPHLEQLITGQLGHSAAEIRQYRDWLTAQGLKLPPLPESWDVALPARGLGDVIAKVTTRLGIAPCGGCKQRQATLNRVFPFKHRPGLTPEFITIARLMQDAQTLASRLPPETAQIVGVARSGLCVASLVAMLLHRPLAILRQSQHDIVPAGNGWRLSGYAAGTGPVVVIDDTVMTGNSLRDILPVVRRTQQEVLTAAV